PPPWPWPCPGCARHRPPAPALPPPERTRPPWRRPPGWSWFAEQRSICGECKSGAPEGHQTYIHEGSRWPGRLRLATTLLSRPTVRTYDVPGDTEEISSGAEPDTFD